MKKQDKIQDSPEFQHYKDDFENFKKGMEDDREYADLKMPDGWEQDFAKTIDDTLDGNERKRRNRIVKRIVGVAAAVVLVVGVGNLTAEQVSGENLLEMFMNKLLVGERKHETYGTFTEIELDEDDETDIVYFDGTTLKNVSEQIREELKSPMFYLQYIPDGFIVEESSYDKVYRIINIKLVRDEEYIYIFQQKQVNEIASGIIGEEIDEIKESDVINNTALDKTISIYSNFRDNSYSFNVMMSNDLITIDTSLPREECIKIAENIDYK